MEKELTVEDLNNLFKAGFIGHKDIGDQGTTFPFILPVRLGNRQYRLRLRDEFRTSNAWDGVRWSIFNYEIYDVEEINDG